MAGKKGTTTQPGDFSKDRIERILAEARGEAQTVPLVSRAPKPPSPLRFHPKLTRPKPTQMPRGWEQYFPGDLIALTTVIIGKAIREFSDQTQTLPLCKHVVSELTPHLCARVQRKTLRADEALSKMFNVLHCRSAYNCDDSEASYRVEQDTIGSDECLKLAKEMARVPSAAANDSSRLAPAQPPPATVANGGGRERVAATKKTRKGDPTLLDRKDRVSFRTTEQYLGINERQRQHLVKSGALIVKGQGHNRKITTESLRKYLPPENPK